MEDEPDIKKENLADSDESPLGDTTEHAGEEDPDEEPRFKGGESAAGIHPGEAEGAESVAPPESERLANREDV